MIARRLLIVTMVALLVAVGVRTAVTTEPSTPDEAVAATLDDTRADLAVNSRTPQTESTTTLLETSGGAASTPVRSAAMPTTVTSSPSVELIDLVDASRPSLTVAKVVDNGEHDPTQGEPDTSVGAIAAEVVVSAWTWRFDDSEGRVGSQLVGLANDAVTEALAPTPQEQVARAGRGEVSWVIVRDVTVAASVATVMFDQHLVTSTTAETITARVAVVTVVDGRAIEVTE